nr:MAG: phosphoprotein [Adumi ohlsrhavirus]
MNSNPSAIFQLWKDPRNPDNMKNQPERKGSGEPNPATREKEKEKDKEKKSEGIATRSRAFFQPGGSKLLPLPSLRDKKIIAQKGLQTVTDGLDETSVEEDKQPLSDECPTVMAPPKMRQGGRNIIQAGPSRVAQQRPIVSNVDHADTKEKAQEINNIQLQRTQHYLPEELSQVDSESTDLASKNSDSSTGTFFDEESESDDLDYQTVAECNDLGIDPHAIHDKIRSLKSEFKGLSGRSEADDIIYAVNRILASAASIPGRKVTDFKIDGDSIIGSIREDSTLIGTTEPPLLIQGEFKYPPPVKMPENQTPKIIDLGTVGIVQENKPKPEPIAMTSSTEPSETKHFVFTLPKIKPGPNLKFKLPVAKFEHILQRDKSELINGILILKAANLYMRYVLSYDLTKMHWEIQQ